MTIQAGFQKSILYKNNLNVWQNAMKKKIWIIGSIILLSGIVAIALYFLLREEEVAPPKMNPGAMFKSHLVMYTKSAANIYAGMHENTEVVKKLLPDERLYVDQPYKGWFPVYPVLIDSIKNLEKNMIGYIRGEYLISTSTTMRRGFVRILQDKFKLENKNITINLRDMDTVIDFNHPLLDDLWVTEFTQSETFQDIRNLGFEELVISNGTNYTRRWKFD